MMDRTHALEILGFKNADPLPEEIKQRYKQLSKAVHPDAGGSNWLFLKVNEAYQTLSGEGPGPTGKPQRCCTKEETFTSPDFSISFRVFYTLIEHRFTEFAMTLKGGGKFNFDIHDLEFYNPPVVLSVEVKAEQVFRNNIHTREAKFKARLLGSVDMPPVTLILPPGFYRIQLRFIDNPETSFLPKPCNVLILPWRRKTVKMQADVGSIFSESKLNFQFICQTKATDGKAEK